MRQEGRIDGQRHGTHGEADEGRRGEALLGARYQHHPGDQHVPQASREGEGDPLRGDRKARRRARQREAWVRKSGASPSPTGRRRPVGISSAICRTCHSARQNSTLGGMGPFSAGGSRGSPHGPHVREMPALPRAQFSSNARKGNTRQDVRANRLQGGRARGDRAGTAQGVKGGNIVRAIPRACLRLAKFVLRPAPRLMQYAVRKEPPCCTDLLNVRVYSAN